LAQKGNRPRGTVIAFFPLDNPDFQENNMKNTRLIERNLQSKQFHPEDKRDTDSQPLIDARKTMTRWVRERQELRPIYPRRQFAALFRNAG
jgi:hypothetical protein